MLSSLFPAGLAAGLAAGLVAVLSSLLGTNPVISVSQYLGITPAWTDVSLPFKDSGTSLFVLPPPVPLAASLGGGGGGSLLNSVV